MRKHPEFAQLMTETLPWIHLLLYGSLGCGINTNAFLTSKVLPSLDPVYLSSFLFPFLALYSLLASSGFPMVSSSHFSVHPNMASLLPYPQPQSLLYRVLLLSLPDKNVIFLSLYFGIFQIPRNPGPFLPYSHYLFMSTINAT